MTCKLILTFLSLVEVTKSTQVVPVSSITGPVELPNRIGDAAEFGIQLLDRANQIKRKVNGSLRVDFGE